MSADRGSTTAPKRSDDFPATLPAEVSKLRQALAAAGFKGNSTEDREKGGILEFLSSDNKTVLFSLTFSNLGIFRLTRAPQDSAQSIRRVKAEMYVERIAFAAPQPPA